MRDRFAGSMATVAIAAATVIAAIWAPVMSITPASAQVALKTPWGEPDLKESGRTNLIRRYNAPPSTLPRNSSPRRNGKN